MGTTQTHLENVRGIEPGEKTEDMREGYLLCQVWKKGNDWPPEQGEMGRLHRRD